MVFVVILIDSVVAAVVGRNSTSTMEENFPCRDSPIDRRRAYQLTASVFRQRAIFVRD